MRKKSYVLFIDAINFKLRSINFVSFLRHPVYYHVGTCALAREPSSDMTTKNIILACPFLFFILASSDNKAPSERVFPHPSGSVNIGVFPSSSSAPQTTKPASSSQITKGISSVQNARPPSHMQPSQASQAIQGMNIPVNIQAQSIPANMQAQSISANMQAQTVPINIQAQKIQTNIQANMQAHNVPVNIQSQNVPVNMQAQNVPVNMQAQNVPANLQAQNIPVNMQPRNLPVHMQPQMVQQNIQTQNPHNNVNTLSPGPNHGMYARPIQVHQNRTAFTPVSAPASFYNRSPNVVMTPLSPGVPLSPVVPPPPQTSPAHPPPFHFAPPRNSALPVSPTLPPTTGLIGYSNMTPGSGASFGAIGQTPRPQTLQMAANLGPSVPLAMARPNNGRTGQTNIQVRQLQNSLLLANNLAHSPN